MWPAHGVRVCARGAAVLQRSGVTFSSNNEQVQFSDTRLQLFLLIHIWWLNNRDLVISLNICRNHGDAPAVGSTGGVFFNRSTELQHQGSFGHCCHGNRSASCLSEDLNDASEVSHLLTAGS